MPITQERFLEVIEGGSRLIDLTTNIQKIVKKLIKEQLTNANSVINRSPDTYAKETMQEFKESFMMIEEILTSHRESFIDFETTIKTEQKYFQRFGKANQRSREYQQRKRYVDNSLQNPDYIKPKSQAEIKADKEWEERIANNKRLKAEMIAEEERLKQIKEESASEQQAEKQQAEAKAHKYYEPQNDETKISQALSDKMQQVNKDEEKLLNLNGDLF